MALASLRFDNNREIEESRQGFVIYGGAPSRFHEWEFRTMLKFKAIADDDDKKRREVTASVIDSLRSDALTEATDIGVDKLMQPEGIPTLVAALKAKAFPKLQSEAKELYKLGHETTGVLARQHGESMLNYAQRRRRWWSKLQSMDNTFTLSTHTLGELMLDAAKLNKVERLMVLTSTGNSSLTVGTT